MSEGELSDKSIIFSRPVVSKSANENSLFKPTITHSQSGEHIVDAAESRFSYKEISFDRVTGNPISYREFSSTSGSSTTKDKLNHEEQQIDGAMDTAQKAVSGLSSIIRGITKPFSKSVEE
jgi:hypothetical protein